MPTIVIASSKGGAGKSTIAILLASELARQCKGGGMNVTIIDSDPNQHSAKWAKKEGCPSNIFLVENSNEESVLDDIEKAEEETSFVVVDVEGIASLSVAHAISRADLVIIPTQGSQDDADEAIKTIRLIKRQSKALRRNIDYSVMFTRTNPAIIPRTLKYIRNAFIDANINMFEHSLVDREAFRAIRSFGGSLEDLDPKEVSGIDKAIFNVRTITEEVKRKLMSGADND